MEIMPALWSVLLDDLSDHFTGGLQGFVIDVDHRTCLEPVGCSVQQFAAAALLRSIPKKFQGDIDKVSADNAAFALFSEFNARAASWTPDVSCLGPYDEVVLGEIKKTIWDFFNPSGFPLIDFASIEAYSDFGPGTSPGARECSFLDKIGHSELTASSKLVIDLFDQWLRASPARVDCEITRLLACGNPKIIRAVKITPVEKTAKISRLVKPEPLLNMFFQKGIQRLMENRLQEFFGIDLASQPSVNSELARLGSIDKRFCTLDLKSASDCISMNLCSYLLPRNLLTWLKVFRSEEADIGGEIVPLHMMATMGNAFCFPLQTIIFACIVKGVYDALGIPFKRKSYEVAFRTDPLTHEVVRLDSEFKLPNWGVFGDDIVVDWEAFDTIKRVLRFYGFVPNMEKSFGRYDGGFRESCGADYLNGTNVRGVYVSRLDTDQDWYVLINNLTNWSARTGILLKRTLDFCLQFVQRCEVPPWENPDSGIRMPLDCVRTQSVYRASRPHKNGSHYQGSYLYKRWVPRDKSFDVSDEVAALANGYWNSSAIFQAALKGVLRGGRVSIRMWETPYRKRVGVAPCWDYMAQEDLRSKFKSSWFRMARVYFGS